MENNKYNFLNYKNNIIIIFFFLLIINYLFFNYRILSRENGYILGDWILNYNGGFVRRGLIGHLFFNISKTFNISIINITYVFSSFIYISSLFLFYRILKKNTSNILILIFIFLPSTFLFVFFDPLTAGRKEILILFFFLIYFLNLKNNNFYYKIFIFILSVIIMLTHEILFFQLPYLFVLRYLYIKKINNDPTKLKNYSLEILIFTTGLILFFLIFKFSNLHNNDALCNSLTEIGLSTNVCYGTINDFGRNSKMFYALWSYFFDRNYFINYSIYTLLTLLPLTYIYLNSKNKPFGKKIFGIAFFCFLFSILFIVRVNDWGRYLNLSFLLQFLICLSFVELGNDNKKINFKLNKYVKVLALIAYLTSWHMPHCCNPNIGNGYYDLYSRVKSRIYDESVNSTKYKDLPREFIRKLLNIQ